MNYTKQDYERDLKIVADAPERWTHVGMELNLYDELAPIYVRHVKRDTWLQFHRKSNNYGVMKKSGVNFLNNIRSRNDIQNQMALYKANQKLAAVIGESIKDRYEQYDHTYHVYCNFCDGNLTKSKGVHDDDCILKELTND